MYLKLEDFIFEWIDETSLLMLLYKIEPTILIILVCNILSLVYYAFEINTAHDY